MNKTAIIIIAQGIGAIISSILFRKYLKSQPESIWVVTWKQPTGKIANAIFQDKGSYEIFIALHKDEIIEVNEIQC